MEKGKRLGLLPTWGLMSAGGDVGFEQMTPIENLPVDVVVDIPLSWIPSSSRLELELVQMPTPDQKQSRNQRRTRPFGPFLQLLYPKKREQSALCSTGIPFAESLGLKKKAHGQKRSEEKWFNGIRMTVPSHPIFSLSPFPSSLMITKLQSDPINKVPTDRDISPQNEVIGLFGFL